MVDDQSTDRTVEIARSFACVTVLPAAPLESGWTGKNNAVFTAARRARGRWLLFTDADTVHEPGNLLRALHEATRRKVGVLSYSPRQIVSGVIQRSLMPLIFCELALAYPPAKVSDPNARIAAANGQFLLVEREAYRRLGGHAGVSDKVLEDVELAFLAKRRKVGLWFRYAEDAVSARMYRSTAALTEGWTKNLALLFHNALALSIWRVLDIFLLIGLPWLAIRLWNARLSPHSLEWRRRLGADPAMGAQPGPLLPPRGPLQLSLCGLPDLAARAAAVFAAALPQLVSAPHVETRKLEGTGVRTVRETSSDGVSH